MARQRRKCIICRVRPVHGRNRCSTCLRYLDRNGVDRPEHVRVAAGARRLIREQEAALHPDYRSSTLKVLVGA